MVPKGKCFSMTCSRRTLFILWRWIVTLYQLNSPRFTQTLSKEPDICIVRIPTDSIKDNRPSFKIIIKSSKTRYLQPTNLQPTNRTDKRSKIKSKRGKKKERNTQAKAALHLQYHWIVVLLRATFERGPRHSVKAYSLLRSTASGRCHRPNWAHQENNNK